MFATYFVMLTRSAFICHSTLCIQM